jgi:arsenite methyltransferase
VAGWSASTPAPRCSPWPPGAAPALRSAGFENVRAAGHAFATTEASPETFGASIIPLIEDFVAGRNGITADDARAWAAEQRQLGADGDFFFGCIQFCFTATRVRLGYAANVASP